QLNWIIFLVLTVGLSIVSSARAQNSKPADSANIIDQKTQTQSYNIWNSKRATGNWGGLRSNMENSGVRLSLSYQSQYQQNFRGGLDTHNGHRFSGSYDLALEFDFEKMGLIQGGSFYFKVKGNYSDGINPDKVGALNNTNADAVDDLPIYVRKWWYRQNLFDDKIELRLGRFTTRKGIVDVGIYARHEDIDFLNISSIRNTTIPHRNGIGAVFVVRPVDWLYFTSAAVDANARRTRTGFDSAFHDDPGYVGYWELGFTPQWETAKGLMPGKYRIGWWYDSTSKSIFRNDRIRSGDLGIYIGLDQMIYKENNDPSDSQGLGVFARYGHASRDVNRISDYWQVGASYQGLVPSLDQDVFGFSVSQSILSREFRNHVNQDADQETVYEWYYRWNLTPWLNISPNLQVITNPGGNKGERNALVGGVRIQAVF
ncbi:MAG: carbohydrate porin, partial [Planctomycetota bacterium]